MRFACWITKRKIWTHIRNIQYLLLFHGNSGSLKFLRLTLHVLCLVVMTSPTETGFLIITLILYNILQITILSRPLLVSIFLRVVNTTYHC